jgi:hypothetical protein
VEVEEGVAVRVLERMRCPWQYLILIREPHIIGKSRLMMGMKGSAKAISGVFQPNEVLNDYRKIEKH